MYIPEIKGDKPTKESRAYSLMAFSQGKFDSFWGNFYLGRRLDTTVGAALSFTNQSIVAGLSSEESIPMTEKEWEGSEFYREGLSYSKGMNSYRAKILSDDFDNIQYQRFLNTKTRGVGEGIIKFSGRLAGNIPDPINFIPFLGAGSKLLKLSPLAFSSKLASSGLLKTAMTKPAVRGALEVGLATTAVQPFIEYTYSKIGEERTWQQVTADIAIGASFGAAFSTIGAAIKNRSKSKVLEPGVVTDESIEIPQVFKRNEIDYKEIEKISEKIRKHEIINEQIKTLQKPKRILDITRDLIKRKKQSQKAWEKTDQSLFKEIEKLKLSKKLPESKHIIKLREEKQKLKESIVNVFNAKKISIVEKKIKSKTDEINKFKKTQILTQKTKNKKVKDQIKSLEEKSLQRRKEFEKKQKPDLKAAREKNRFAIEKLKARKAFVEKKELLNLKKRNDELIEKVTLDMSKSSEIGSFSQKIQVDGTKAFSSSVSDVVDGRMANVEESGLEATNAILKRYGSNERSVASITDEPIKTPEKISDEKIEPIEIKQEKLLSEQDIVEIKGLDRDIEISAKLEDMMTLAKNCLTGSV